MTCNISYVQLRFNWAVDSLSDEGCMVYKQTEFRETSKLSFLSLNCHFEAKPQNDNQGEFLAF